MSKAQVEGEEEAAGRRIWERVRPRCHLLVAKRADFGVEARVAERHPQVATGERQTGVGEVESTPTDEARPGVGHRVTESHFAQLDEARRLHVRIDAATQPRRESLLAGRGISQRATKIEQ